MKPALCIVKNRQIFNSDSVDSDWFKKYSKDGEPVKKKNNHIPLSWRKKVWKKEIPIGFVFYQTFYNIT